MHWTHPDTQGDVPPPCRAHTATLVDRKIVIFGGGEGPTYYNSVYILDVPLRKWSQPTFLSEEFPPPRRAHTAVYYKGKIWVFGGGNGMKALNDLWTLDVSGPMDKLRWEQVQTSSRRPSPRGYHTANLIGSVMIVVGGSDGRDCFSDVWALDLGTLSSS
jgi:Rab9 effector protein with kelch motifs